MKSGGTHAETWQERLASSPYGHLLADNTFLKTIRTNPKLYFLHCTTSLDTVLEQKRLYASTGCLVGSIYCAAMQQVGSGLLVHNLGSYIFEHEIPRTLKAKGYADRSPSALVIEAQLSITAQGKAVGIDYLNLGSVHLKVLEQTKDTLSTSTYSKLERNCMRQIMSANGFLGMCSRIVERPDQVPDVISFFRELRRSIRHLPILGYFYFEALSEYIVLFSQDERSKRLADSGELNCWGYKEFIFRVRPELLQSFNLANFDPSIQEISHTVDALTDEGSVRLNASQLLVFIHDRVTFLVNTYLLDEKTAPMQALCQDFRAMATYFPQLVGHTVDREIRKIPRRYGEYSALFDAYKAATVWDYWNKAGAAVPFNGILPKGEVGINPCNPGVSCKVFRTQLERHGEELYAFLQEQVDISLVAKLVSPSKTLMGLRQPA